MLSELKQYAEEHGLAVRAGFKPKSVKGYIHLSAQGEFLGIQPCEKGYTTYAPDIGAAANGTRYCNFLVEKAKIPLCAVEDVEKDRNIPTKYEFYLSMLDECGKDEPKCEIIASVLRNDTVRNEIVSGLTASKMKIGDPVGFVVDGMVMEKSTAYLNWWEAFRVMFAPEASDELSRCLISGELSVPLATVPKVKGLLSVGGHTAGDAFLCFDKDAFQSFGLKKSYNATVSEEAMTAVNATLTELIQKAPVFGGAKMVHWYMGEVPDDVDIINNMFVGDWDNDSQDEVAEENSEDRAEQERTAMQEAKKFFESLKSGVRPELLSARYYLLPLSGANGRMMVRGWSEGDLKELYENIDMWFRDLRLVCDGTGTLTRPPKLKALCVRLLKPGGDISKVFQRTDDELSNLSGRLLDAIIHNHPLPDEIAGRTLRYIRSMMLTSGEDGQGESSIRKENLAFELLKAWLIRRQRQRGDKIMIGESVATSPKTPAYCCGQLMAVYSAIQNKAMPDVNVGVAERYYAAASSTPAFVIGKLSQLSQHHLSKLEGGISIYYQRMLDAIYESLGNQKIPTTLNQEQQTEFALGYYQQRASMYATNKKD